MTIFDRTTAPNTDTARADFFAVELPEAWGSLVGIHGGYLTALAVRTIESRRPDHRVRTVCTSFFRPVAIGPAIVTIETRRSGRSLATFDVCFTQNDKEAARTRITTATAPDGIRWDHSPHLDVPPPERCITVPGPPGIRHLDHGVGILDPANLPLASGPEAVLRGHLRPAEPRPIDTAWLVVALDFLPPAAWSKVDPPTGAVSVDYTVHIHRTWDRVVAEGEWLAVSLRSDVSADGLALEHGAIAAPDGTLLAESFHTRWTG